VVKPIHTAVNLRVFDVQHQEQERPNEREKGPRSPFHARPPAFISNPQKAMQFHLDTIVGSGSLGLEIPPKLLFIAPEMIE
jgi:hypothetical protein